MLVDTENLPESKSEAPAPAPAHSHLRVRSDLHEEYSSDEIAKMTELYEGTLSNIEEGEIVKSKVLRVTDTAVILDVGFKSEGAVPIDEFKDARSLKEGDVVEVFLEHLEDQEGAVVLSKKKADFMRVWERIREAHEKDEAVSGTLVKKIKGGVVVDLMGVDAFLPGSQIALRRVPNIDELLGQSFEFKIIKLNKRRRNIVVSRRVLLEAERKTKRDVLMKELQVGQTRKGIVKNITDFGALIDLGLKQLQAYPWKNVAAKYPVGTRVQGKVVSITNYGAFVELEPGIEGLVHISDMSWTKRVQHPSEVVKKGDEVEVLILNVDAENKRISLGLKQAQEDPWLRIGETYPVGTDLRGRVLRLMDKGVVVDLGSDIEGFVPMSQLGIPDIQNPGDAVKEGQAVELKVLEVDPIHHRIVLAATGWPKEDSVQETGTQDPPKLDA